LAQGPIRENLCDPELPANVALLTPALLFQSVSRKETSTMSIFSQLGVWLEGVFKKARPGLAQFISTHEAAAVRVLTNTLKEFEGVPLSKWRDRAFADMSQVINSAKTHPDTWISLLVDLAYDIIKAGAA
jgi:hypothetical protein